MPKVSIIVNCFNEARRLRETLDSVFAQTFENWEIVFWDNASTDGSGEIAASYGERVQYFRSESTIPLGSARKCAYEKTSGEYIAILDADDIWLPEKLERQLDLFDADPDVGLTYCDAIYFDDMSEGDRLFKLTSPCRGRVFGKLLAKNFIFSSTMMFRRSALDTLDQAFDDRFTRAQDYDLSLRTAYHYPIDYVDEPLAKWRINGLAEKPWKRSLPSREAEIKWAIENLINVYPRIKTDYGLELRTINGRLDYASAVNAWRDRGPSQARGYLSGHLWGKRFLLVYLCTFFLSFDAFYWLRINFRNVTTGQFRLLKLPSWTKLILRKIPFRQC